VPEFIDPEYGKVVVRRNRRARSVKFSVSPNGQLEVSAPFYTPIRAIKVLLKTSQKDIRRLLHTQRQQYVSSQQIGKSHTLDILQGDRTKIDYKKPRIIVTLERDSDIQSSQIQATIRTYVVKALTLEAKAYLPRRVDYIAQKMNLSYTRLRFSHAKSRWGSCSSTKVISLNIGLMKLPFELIDYVIIHELAHTKELNHSSSFWHLVGTYDPEYRIRRRELKQHSPHI
jgi:predicted metal-dependent hydrolase